MPRKPRVRPDKGRRRDRRLSWCQTLCSQARWMYSTLYWWGLDADAASHCGLCEHQYVRPKSGRAGVFITPVSKRLSMEHPRSRTCAHVGPRLLTTRGGLSGLASIHPTRRHNAHTQHHDGKETPGRLATTTNTTITTWTYRPFHECRPCGGSPPPAVVPVVVRAVLFFFEYVDDRTTTTR